MQLRMKLLHQFTVLRSFSTTCGRFKFYYRRPTDRKILPNPKLYEKRNEISEYAWYKEWFDDEDIDINLAKQINYRPFYEMGDGRRAYEILKYQYHDYIKKIKYYPKKMYKLGGMVNHSLRKQIIFPDYCDIVIIGGGLAGTSIAYHVQRILGDGLHVVIVDKDFSYSEAASVNLPGVIKQQFSTRENFEMSQYAVQFLDNSVEELYFGKYRPHIDLNYAGYLTLGAEHRSDEVFENYKIQRELGASVKLLRTKDLKEKFPWCNTEGIGTSVLGVGQEGWYDSWPLLAAMHRKCSMRGVDYVSGEVIDAIGDITPHIAIARGHPGDFSFITHVVVRLADGTHRKIQCAKAVLAAGWRSGEIAKLFDVGLGHDAYNAPLPITKRKRYLYTVYLTDGPGLNCPFVMDTSMIYFRREGLADIYIIGFSRNPNEDPLANNLTTDDEYFTSEILPVLAHRVKAFADCKIIRSTAVFHDYNEFDQNPIIGYHPGARNLFIATGFGENYVNALSCGNYFLEDLLEQQKVTTNLKRCSFQRMLTREKFVDGATTYLE